MPRQQCYWTRSLELQLVAFVRQREVIWKPVGNTNYQIQQKYKAYAEFAAKLGRGFTARSVRDRWVNIRSTFNHNLRRVERSRKTARFPADVFVPCWPLWKPLQFLLDKNSDTNEIYKLSNNSGASNTSIVKEELASDIDESNFLLIRQRGQRTNRPRRKLRITKQNKCQTVINDLIHAMKPLTNASKNEETQEYCFFGKHVTLSLNLMEGNDAKSASTEILAILDEFMFTNELT